jgi:hypothetical protein
MMNKLFFAFLIATFLQSCQIIEEGEVDYVRTIANEAQDTKSLARCNPELYNKSEFTKAGVTRECYETLYRKYSNVPQISTGETISVHLMQAFNGIAFEWKNMSEFFGNKGSNAEMVIIANVCEQGKSGCSLAFGPKSDKKGRVVFYSNGVKAKQYLNFSFLPVYGPIEYEGGPLIIQISIIELDDPSDQQKNMLKTIAATGGQAYPPASDVLSVLDSIGSAILANSSDDTLFRYTMTLVPDSNSENYQSPIIAEGNYAFIRKNTTKGDLEKEIYDELLFDNLSGRLVKRCTDDENKPTIKKDENGIAQTFDFGPCTLDLNTGSLYKDYRENTYLTFQVKSGFVPKTLDNIQTFQMLLNDINSASDQEALEAIDAISSLKTRLQKKAVQNDLLRNLNNLKITLDKMPTDLYERFSVQAFQMTDYYDVQVNKIKTANCYSPAALAAPAPPCQNYMSQEQLVNVQLAMRSLLNRINPNPSPNGILKAIDDMIPVGANILATAVDMRKSLENGYKKHFNKTLISKYKADFETLSNLSENIPLLKAQKIDVVFVNRRTKLLGNEIRNFLNGIAASHSTREQISCSNILTNTCYKYLPLIRVKELSDIFNRYATKFNVDSSNLLNTADAATLTTSLAVNNIENVVDQILSNFD